MMLTPTALTNPTITALETNRSSEPSLSKPATIISATGRERQGEQGAGRVVGVADRVDIRDDHGHGARALDRHEGALVVSAPVKVPTR